MPLETWGRDVVVSVTESVNIVRVLSAGDANVLTFEPASVHGSVTLNSGEVVTFETTVDFRVRGTAPLMVGQFLAGQNYVDEPAVMEGDPSMSTVVPVEQYRMSYDFVVPDTYNRNFVNVAAAVGATVMVSHEGGANGSHGMETGREQRLSDSSGERARWFAPHQLG